MAPKQSVFRGPDAQHFQLVHRSQRDPLINDPEASQRVLKPVERANERKTGLTLADLAHTVDKSSVRENEGEAASYGIIYDDSAYDYMSHLRPVGENIDAFLLAAPKGSSVAQGMKTDRKGKGRAVDMFALPEGVLASQEEVPVKEVWRREEAVPEELQGLQPDMDPHLRQVLEALEDDAFVQEQEEEGDGWFDELVGGGEREDEGEGEKWEFREQGIEDGDGDVPNGDDKGADREGETWQDRFKAFKREKQDVADGCVMDEADQSEMADTVGSLASNLRDLTVVGGKKRRGKRGPSDASGMSMSSSSMFRNQGLRDLDDRFDRIEREYELEDDDDDFPDDDDDAISLAPSNMSSTSCVSLFSTSSTTAGDVSREDFDAIMDDFLDNYEVVGSKWRQSLGGTALSGLEKLKVLRAAIENGDDALGPTENRRRILEMEKRDEIMPVLEKRERIRREEDEGEKWDAESILSTYTNTENHPATIRSRRIRELRPLGVASSADPKVPLPQQSPQPLINGKHPTPQPTEEESSGSETEQEGVKTTVSRPKFETPDERKARKAAVKVERSARRAEKKSHTTTYADERKRQIASHKKLVGAGRAADLSVAARGVVSLS